MLKVGIVADSRDDSNSGRLSIAPLTPEGTPGEDVFPADMVSPCLGGNEGICAIPGKGTPVLYVDVNEMGLEGIPHKYLWMGAISVPQTNTAGRASNAHDSENADDVNNTEVDPYTRKPGDHILQESSGPEMGNIYGENSLPQRQGWKYRGHAFWLMNKVTESGRCEKGILLQSARGAKLRIDDGPPEQRMDRITIEDEMDPPNTLQIITGGSKPESFFLRTKRDHDIISIEGQQHQIIMGGELDQIRDNVGKGDIKDKAYKGSHMIEAEQDLLRTSWTGDIKEVCLAGDITYAAETGGILIEALGNVTLKCGASTITLTPESIDIVSPIINITGAMNLKGLATLTDPFSTVLNTHTHMDGFIPGFVTSPPLP